MSTFAVMKARIADELNRADLTTQIGYAVLTAIEHYKYDRFWFNEYTTTSSTADGTEYYSLPATILSVDTLKVNDGSELREIKPKPFAFIERIQAEVTPQEDVPYYYAEYKDQIRLFPVPDDIYTLTWAGVRNYTALSADGDTNPWVVEAEELIRQRAKAIVRIDLINQPQALQEASGFMMRNERFLSMLEKASYKALKTNTDKRVTTGRLAAGW